MRLEKWVEAGRIHIKDVVRMLRDQKPKKRGKDLSRKYFLYLLISHIGAFKANYWRVKLSKIVGK